MVIGYGCCVGSWLRFEENVCRDSQQLMVATSGQQHIAIAYNGILEAYVRYHRRHRDLVGVVLQHDDLKITDPNFEYKIRQLLQRYPDGVIGVAGANNIHGLDWWNAKPVGRQQIRGQTLQFGMWETESPAHQGVQMLEGSLLILGIDVVQSLRFDTDFPGFHGYDEFTYRAYMHGFNVLAADLETFHDTYLGFSSPASETAWHEANRLFKQKWNL